MAQEKKKIKISSLFLLIGIALVLFVFLSRILPIILPAKVQIIDSETLKEKVAISDLSTAKFTYNGIAEYKEGDKKICSILYHAIVKVGINMSDIDFDINSEDKTIKPILPEIKINSDVVDETALSFIPSNSNVKLNDAIRVCKEDVQNEASTCEELWSLGEECLKNTIEGLIYPIAHDNGYIIIWE